MHRACLPPLALANSFCSDTAWIHSGYTLTDHLGHNQATRILVRSFMLGLGESSLVFCSPFCFMFFVLFPVLFGLPLVFHPVDESGPFLVKPSVSLGVEQGASAPFVIEPGGSPPGGRLKHDFPEILARRYLPTHCRLNCPVESCTIFLYQCWPLCPVYTRAKGRERSFRQVCVLPFFNNRVPVIDWKGDHYGYDQSFC